MDSLQELYNSYLLCANNIPNWENINKNDLCRLYIQYEDDEFYRSAYMSAIICKYWPKIYRFYKETPLVCTLQDCYDWLLDAIMEAMRRRAWTDPNSNMAKDPNGPDKVINCIMKCIRLNYLIAQNRDKRKLNINTLSKDELDENLSEDYYCSNTNQMIEMIKFNSFDIEELIRFFYNKQEFTCMFIVDAILNLDCDSKKEFNRKKLIKQLVMLDDSYLLIMSKKYGISYSDLQFIHKNCIKDKNMNQLTKTVDAAFNTLRALLSSEYMD